MGLVRPFDSVGTMYYYMVEGSINEALKVHLMLAD